MFITIPWMETTLAGRSVSPALVAAAAAAAARLLIAGCKCKIEVLKKLSTMHKSYKALAKSLSIPWRIQMKHSQKCATVLNHLS